MAELIFEGSKGWLAADSLHSCFFLKGERTLLLFDAGSPRILEKEYALGTDAVFITHSHKDHINSLDAFLHSAQKHGRRTLIAIYSPKLLIGLISPEVIPDIPLSFPVTYGIEIPRKVGEFAVCAYRTQQSTPPPVSVNAYRVSDSKTSIAYATDCSLTDGLKNFCKGADVLVLDASGITPSHMSPAEMKILVEFAKPKTLILTHFDGEFSFEQLRGSIGHPNMFAARAGLTLDVDSIVNCPRKKLMR